MKPERIFRIKNKLFSFELWGIRRKTPNEFTKLGKVVDKFKLEFAKALKIPQLAKWLKVYQNHNYSKPIPLTGQWLKDFGFEQFENYEIYNKEEFQIDKTAEEQSEKGYWFFINKHAINVEYIHQLQNLYFALTGTELIRS